MLLDPGYPPFKMALQTALAGSHSNILNNLNGYQAGWSQRHVRAARAVRLHHVSIQCCLHNEGAAARHTEAEHQEPCSSGRNDCSLTRRTLVASAIALGQLNCFNPARADEASMRSSEAADLDTTITHKVYLDIGIADTALKPAGERALGDKSIVPDAKPVGRIVLGLYGNLVPITVRNFLELVDSDALPGTIFSRVLPGEYIQAGQQGARRAGQVELLRNLQSNPETSSPASFRLTHYRPGTLSLSMSENDEDPRLKQRPDYHNVEFLITTGPGPVPRLDGGNIVFGRVLEGMDIVSTITRVPTFRPLGQQLVQLNQFASAIGDERAVNVRRKYGRPLKAVVIQGAGVLPAADNGNGTTASITAGSSHGSSGQVAAAMT